MDEILLDRMVCLLFFVIIVTVGYGPFLNVRCSGQWGGWLWSVHYNSKDAGRLAMSYGPVAGLLVCSWQLLVLDKLNYLIIIII